MMCLLFDGEDYVKPEELVNTGVHSQYKADDKKLHELERDVAKEWVKSKVDFAILGFENQTIIDKRMPFRVISYDGNSYRSQI